jgi:acyl-lipid omega-6 desaturase (Delta-12 desaturase)
MIAEFKQSQQEIRKAKNGMAFLFLIVPLVMGILSFFSAAQSSSAYVIVGIIGLSLFFTQNFILLHECGHLHFFQHKSWNVWMGNVFGFIAGIPFHSWMTMHHLHHKWTGWRDKDPTTEKTVDPSQSHVVNGIANFSWLIFFPIFYIVYHISNYWDLKKMRRFLKPRDFKLSAISVLIYLLAYVILFCFLSAKWVLILLVSFFLSCVWRELIILTQHTHVDIPLAHDQAVKPISYMDQVPYTRSFYIPSLIAKYFLFNFNLHEAHHAFPGMPAYYLDEVELGIKKEPSYWIWFKKAKSMSGVDFVFKTNKDTKIKF